MPDAVVAYGSCFVALSRISQDVDGDDDNDNNDSDYGGSDDSDGSEDEDENDSDRSTMIYIHHQSIEH